MEPRAFLFSRLCCWGLTASCAALGLFGVLGMFTPDGTFWGLDRTGWCVLAFAFVMAFAIMSVNNMAEAAMHAIDGRPFEDWHWPTLAPALICAVGFAIGSNIGVHLGWSILSAHAAAGSDLPGPATIDRIFLFLCAAKPLSMLAVAGRQAMDRAHVEATNAAQQTRRDEDSATARDQGHAERLAKIAAGAAPRPAETIPTPSATSDNVTVFKVPAPRATRPRAAASAKAAVGAGLGLGAGQAIAHADVPHTAPARAPIEAARHAGGDPQVARAVALRDKGMARADVASAMKCSERTVTRLWARAVAANAMALAS